jgi:MFS family permease
VSERGLAGPLRWPVFRRLAATYAVNELGDWMGLIALSVLVYDRTGSVLATTALFMGTGFAPALLAPLLVTRAEQWPPRFALPVLYCGEAVLFGVLALLADNFSLAPVIVLAAIDGALAITTRSLTRAVVASVLEPSDELRAGNAILNIAFTGGAAVGPALAGVIVAGFGVQTALLLDAVSFYAIAWIILTAGPLPHGEVEPGRMRERLRAGVAYVREKRTLRRLLLALSAVFILFSTVIPVEVVYAKETLGASDSGYGLMLGCWGLGMVLGSVIFARLNQASLPRLLFFSALAIGAGYLCLAVAPNLALACAASVVGGAGNGVLWVSSISAVQELTVSGMQARVMSILESISTAMPGVGFALGGAIAAVSSPRVTFLVAGAGVLAILAVAVPALGDNWVERRTTSYGLPDSSNDVVLELIPAGALTESELEAKS